MARDDDTPPGRWLRIYRPAWWALAGPVAVVGLAGLWLEVGAGGALALLAGFAVLGTFGVWQFGPRRGDGRLDLAVSLLGAAWALGFLAVVGLSYEFAATGFVFGTFLAAAGWPLRQRRAPASPPDRPAAVPGAAVPARPAVPAVTGPDLEQVPAAPLPDSSALRAASTAQLCWTWRASYVCLRRYPWPSYLECLAELRGVCLDELERRDPVAFARWFPTARAASDPARYFCGESQR